MNNVNGKLTFVVRKDLDPILENLTPLFSCDTTTNILILINVSSLVEASVLVPLLYNLED